MLCCIGAYKKKRELKILLQSRHPAVLIWSTVSHFLRRSFDTWENQTRLELVKCKSAWGTCLQVIRRHSLPLWAVIKYLISWEGWPSKEGDVIKVIYLQIWAPRRHVAERLSSGFWKTCIQTLGEAMDEITSLWLQLALQFITQNGPWEGCSWNSENLPSLWNQQHCAVALPDTVLAGVKSLFFCPLPFPSFHPGLLPAEIEPVQTDPWPRPAACSGCLPRGAAGPHCEAAVSITKKEKSQLSMELRTRTFTSSGMHISKAWPNWSPWWKARLTKETCSKSQFFFFCSR